MDNNNGNNNNDNWSNRNWQDARGFGNMGQNSQNNNESMFDSIFKNNRGGIFGGGNGSRDPNSDPWRYSTAPGNNAKIGGNWMRGRNSLGVIVIVLVIIIIFTFYSQFAMNESITKSTIQRTKIESSFDYENDACITDLGITVEDEDALRNSFKIFHEKTGVIPYIYILEIGDTAIDLEALADEKYTELIDDENHFFVVLQPNSGMTCSYSYRLGENAEKVMDAEAVQIYNDYLQKFYADRQTYNQTYLVNTYGYTADRIMSTANMNVNSLIFGIIIIVILVCVIIYWVKKKKREELDENDPNRKRIEKDMNRRW